MKYTLVIIDMQERWEPFLNKDKILSNISNEITRAIENNNDIIFVEFRHHSNTLDYYLTYKELTCLASNYSKKHLVLKNYMDGSKEISDYIYTNNIYSDNIKVCGIATNACVKKTVIGLTNRMSSTNIVVVEQACSDHNKEYHDNGILEMSKIAIILNDNDTILYCKNG